MHSAIPEETAIETHFYSAQNTDGTMDTQIEEYLQSVESNAAPVYEALLRGEIPKDSQARVDFSIFLALMYVRTPAMRRMYAEGYSQLLLGSSRERRYSVDGATDEVQEPTCSFWFFFLC
jgi:hypothetical protein